MRPGKVLIKYGHDISRRKLFCFDQVNSQELQYPCRKYEKCSRYQISEYDYPSKITGVVCNVNESPYCIVDFDISKEISSEKKLEVQKYIIQGLTAVVFF